MDEIQIASRGEIAAGQILDVFPGESLEVRAINVPLLPAARALTKEQIAAGEVPQTNTVEIVKSPTGANVTIDGRTISVDKPGHYLFKVNFLTERWRHLELFCFEPAVMDLVRETVSGRSDGRTFAERRQVLYYIATDPVARADGTLAGIRETAQRTSGLQRFGA